MLKNKPNKNAMPEECVRELLASVVLQAVNDYKKIQRGEKVPSTTKQGLEDFFNYCWFDDYVPYDCRMILKKLKENKA